MRSALLSRGIDEDKSLEIENGALELWDRAYQAWVMPIQPSVGPTVTPDAVLASCNNFLERLSKTPGNNIKFLSMCFLNLYLVTDCLLEAYII